MKAVPLDALGKVRCGTYDAYIKAGTKIDKGNKELKESIYEYTQGNVNSAGKHYASALKSYDEALDLID